MGSYLCLSASFLDQAFHGLQGKGESEWPPSPLRFYQALVAVAAAKWPAYADSWKRATFGDTVAKALHWLEGLDAPVIVAPTTSSAQSYWLSVPNNAMDIVAQAWTRGVDTNKGDASPATHRAMKGVRPQKLSDGSTVFYVWALPEDPSPEVQESIDTLTALARQVYALGWGTDLVYGNGRLLSKSDAEGLVGNRWTPGKNGSNALRVPDRGSFAALQARHQQFLNRLSGSRFIPAAPLPNDSFRTVAYHRDHEPATRSFAAFKLLQLDASALRPFDAQRGCAVAGMARHLVSQAASEARWNEERIATFILGHGESAGTNVHSPVGANRLAYIPLPTIEPRGTNRNSVVTSIRRILLTVLAEGHESEINWCRRALSGRDLIDETKGTPQALLSLIPENDTVVQLYTRAASNWSTVTPVILPGRDDRNHRKTESLIRKAIRQAGFPEVLASCAEIEWRNVGFLQGVDLASRYFVPRHLREYPRYHVRIQWRLPNGGEVRIRGPICLGGGRYSGIGLFAPL